MFAFRPIQLSVCTIAVVIGAIALSQWHQTQDAEKIDQAIASEALMAQENWETQDNRNPGAFPRPKRRQRHGEFLRSLNLSRSQIRQLMVLRAQYKPEIREHRFKLRTARMELRDLMGSDASSNEVEEKFNQVQSLRQQLEQLRFKTMLGIRDILNKEQRRAFLERNRHRRQFQP